MSEKKKILILNGQYLPGYKGGGPIRSTVNMVNNLSDEFEFFIITSDRDFKSNEQYKNIKVNQWNEVGLAKVFYMSPDKQRLYDFKKLINSMKYDFIYLNGFFSPIFSIKPLILRRLNLIKSNGEFILSPRGDFSGGLEVKKLKKYIYIFLVKLIGLYRNLRWHATSELEEKDIKKIFKKSNVLNISNLPNKLNINKIERLHKVKEVNKLKLVFISRIHKKKNLIKALEILLDANMHGEIILDIYGPIEDQQYWSACKEKIKNMPYNVTINYKGEINHSEVEGKLEEYHALFLPTKGENYGHVIVEALYAGCMVLISDRTPWNNLEENGVGWSVSLENVEKYKNSIKYLLNLNNQSFDRISKKAVKFIVKESKNEDVINKYKQLFKGEEF